MRLTWGLEPQVCQFVGAFAGGRDFGPCQALAMLEGGRLVGGAVIHDWNPEAETIEISAATTRKINWRRPVRMIAGYVFGTVKCQAAIIRTAEGNTAVRRLARSMGGTEHIIPRLRGRMASEALIVITLEAWQSSRWVK